LYFADNLRLKAQSWGDDLAHNLKVHSGAIRDCYLVAFFTTEPYLTDFIDRAAAGGIKTFGDLENISEEALFTKIKTTVSNRLRFKRSLANLGIEYH
jgi:hypothetical protein